MISLKKPEGSLPSPCVRVPFSMIVAWRCFGRFRWAGKQEERESTFGRRAAELVLTYPAQPSGFPDSEPHKPPLLGLHLKSEFGLWSFASPSNLWTVLYNRKQISRKMRRKLHIIMYVKFSMGVTIP